MRLLGGGDQLPLPLPGDEGHASGSSSIRAELGGGAHGHSPSAREADDELVAARVYLQSLARLVVSRSGEGAA